jgi:hypothetical protein
MTRAELIEAAARSVHEWFNEGFPAGGPPLMQRLDDLAAALDAPAPAASPYPVTRWERCNCSVQQIVMGGHQRDCPAGGTRRGSNG